MRIRYRAGQFFKALHTHPSASQLEQAKTVLKPALLALFLQMQPAEQAHSLAVYEQLIANGEKNSDLLAAALLHDVGKIRAPLRIWERVIIVIAYYLLPDRIAAWGKGRPVGWKRTFVVAEQHPAWGAEMAAKAGAPPMTVEIIRRHHQPVRSLSAPGKLPPLEDHLILELQTIDEES